MKNHIDLNSDMGEGFGAWMAGDNVDEQIMPLISSANIATGFHAGDPNIMDKTVAQAKALGVGIGAHPGFRDLAGFGRRHINASDDELINDLVYQVGALQAFAVRHGVPLQHVKAHGALYMYLSENAELSQRYADTVARIAPQAAIFCLPGSATEKAARAAGITAVREFYGDRHYNDSGNIVFIRKMGALSPEAVAEKVVTACTEGRVKTVDNHWIDVEFDSVCIHSDTPGALALIEATANALQQAGIRIQSPVIR